MSERQCLKWKTNRQQNVGPKEQLDPDYEEPKILKKKTFIDHQCETITISLQSTGQTHSKCVICNKPGPKLICVKHGYVLTISLC